MTEQYTKRATKLRLEYIARIDEIKVKSSFGMKLSSLIESAAADSDVLPPLQPPSAASTGITASATVSSPSHMIGGADHKASSPSLIRTKSTEAAVTAAEVL